MDKATLKQRLAWTQRELVVAKTANAVSHKVAADFKKDLGEQLQKLIDANAKSNRRAEVAERAVRNFGYIVCQKDTDQSRCDRCKLDIKVCREAGYQKLLERAAKEIDREKLAYQAQKTDGCAECEHYRDGVDCGEHCPTRELKFGGA